MQHVACVWSPRCCNVLRHVGCCWLIFENGQNFHATFVDGCMMLFLFGRVHATMLRLGMCTSLIFSSQHVATRWPNACNMLRPTILRSVAIKCCDRCSKKKKKKKKGFYKFVGIDGKKRFSHSDINVEYILVQSDLVMWLLGIYLMSS